MSKVKYWDAPSTSWKTVDTPTGTTGPGGAPGPDGKRTSCGAVDFNFSQCCQPNGAIWHVDNFVIDALSTDPNPCLSVSASNELQVMRAGSLLLSVTLALVGSRYTARSMIEMQVYRSSSDYDTIARIGPIPVEDTVSTFAIAQLAAGARLRVYTMLQTNAAGNISYSGHYTGALAAIP